MGASGCRRAYKRVNVFFILCSCFSWLFMCPPVNWASQVQNVRMSWCYTKLERLTFFLPFLARLPPPTDHTIIQWAHWAPKEKLLSVPGEYCQNVVISPWGEVMGVQSGFPVGSWAWRTLWAYSCQSWTWLLLWVIANSWTLKDLHCLFWICCLKGLFP